jgi:hypothetical protein
VERDVEMEVVKAVERKKWGYYKNDCKLVSVYCHVFSSVTGERLNLAGFLFRYFFARPLFFYLTYIYI